MTAVSSWLPFHIVKYFEVDYYTDTWCSYDVHIYCRQFRKFLLFDSNTDDFMSYILLCTNVASFPCKEWLLIPLRSSQH